MKEIFKELNLHDKKMKDWDEDILFAFASLMRKKTKPMLIAANKVDVPGALENYERLKKEFPDYIIIPCSAESELALKEANKHELIDYIPGSNDFSIKGDLKR